jgi:hypothetical protein
MTMRLRFDPIVVLLATALLAGACASGRKSDSEKEWERAECRQILDSDARTKCLERVEKE